MFTDKSWSSRTRWLKDKIKYDVTMTARCPEWGEDINVGTAGPAGLSQHTGKCKCKKNVERKKKHQKEARCEHCSTLGWRKWMSYHKSQLCRGLHPQRGKVWLHHCPSLSIHRQGRPEMMFYDQKTCAPKNWRCESDAWSKRRCD